MDLFIRRPPEFYQLYNCSFYNVTSVPLEKRQNIPLGLTFLTLGVFEWILYVPCMAAIWKHMEHPCYKIMFYMGILDMACMFVNSIGTGILGLLGAVYCSFPNLIYVMGVAGLTLWCTESSIEIFLALNRCIEICSPRWGQTLFSGYRTWLWMIPPTLYGLYVAGFTMPVAFTGIYFSWFFNPHVGYADDYGNIYHNSVHTIHNWIVVVMLTGLYLTFAIILAAKTYSYRNQAGGSAVNNYSQKMIFVQVVLISTVNVIAATIYVYMQYYRITDFLIVLAQFTWFQAHGIPPVIYLIMNKTIRSNCADIILKVFCGIDRQQALYARGRSQFPSGSAGRGFRRSVRAPTTGISILHQSQKQGNGNGNRVEPMGKEEFPQQQNQGSPPAPQEHLYPVRVPTEIPDLLP